MLIRILVTLGLVVLGAGFIFFVANVIWLGTKEFFKVYGSKSRTKVKTKTKTKKKDPSSNAVIASPTTIKATTSTT